MTPNTPAEFEALVRSLMSADNAVRAPAEKVYDSMKQSADALVMALLQIIRSNAEDAVRSMCLILLRPLLVRESEALWEKLQPQTKTVVCTELLNALESEQNDKARNHLCSAIADLGVVLIPKGQWGELLPFMFKCTQSAQENHREAALNIFSDLAGSLGDSFRNHFNVLNGVLSAGLVDPASFKVRVAALAATATFLQVLTEPHERQMFQQLTPAMLNTISDALRANKEEEAQNALSLFVELAEADPVFFRPNIGSVVDIMLAISGMTNFDDSVRHLAIEVLLTLAENRAGMMRKMVPNFIPRMLQMGITFMLTLEDEPIEEWNNNPDADETDITDYDIGEETLDRIALAMGGKTVVPELFNLVKQLLANPDWKHRYCALMATSVVGEGCYKFLLPHLTDVMNLILPTFSDPHPRVRWGACNCIGQMSTDFQPTLQNDFHGRILPALMSLMDDTANIRVQAHAAAAVINFCEEFDSDILATYLDGLLSKLLALLQSGKIVVQEQAITAIAAIADCATENFDKYYDSFVPLLKDILVGAEKKKEYRKLRGKAMECISLIGVAVGKERFLKDANDVIKIMLKTQSEPMEADDPQIAFMQQAWARICKCLGSDFVPCLAFVMPPLLELVGQKTSVSILDADQEVEPQEGWEYVDLDNKRVGINTTGMEEKANACNMIYCYADELGEGFFPYVDKVVKLMIPLIKFIYNNGVRTAAVSCMPPLLRSAAEYMSSAGAATGADKLYVRNMFTAMEATFYEAMEQELDVDILNIMLDSYVQCLDVVGEDGLTPPQLKTAFEFFHKTILQEYLERRGTYNEQKKDADIDEEEEEKIDDNMAMDEECLGNCADALGRLIKFHKSAALPFLEPLMKIILDFLQPTCSPAERQSAICIIDDIIEHTGQDSIALLQMVLPAYIGYISDEEPIIRQAAAYGIGIFAGVGGDLIKPHIPEILQRLNRVITAAESRSEDNIGATENSISAVGRIAEKQPGSVDLVGLLPVWLNYLPVTEDKIESLVIYNQLCGFIENPSTTSAIFGAGYQHLPKVLSVFAAALDSDLGDDELTARIVNIIKMMQAQLAEPLQAASGVISPEERDKIAKALMPAQQ